MALFNDFSRKITSVGQNTAAKAQNVAESVKLTTSIDSAKREMDNYYLTLGKELFAICLEKNTNMDNPTVQKLVTLQNQIDQGNAQLTQLRKTTSGGSVCSRCGAEVPAGSRFCSQCGGPVEMAKPLTLDTVCPSCGAVVTAGNKFCNRCGATLAQPAAQTAQPVFQPTAPVANPIVPPTTPKVPMPEPAAPVTGDLCKYCGSPVPAGNNFCPTCGQSVGEPEPPVVQDAAFEPVTEQSGDVARFCSNCGATLVAGTRFCVECGAPIEE
jgi:ribosomal protein L40E